jgi:ribosomal protein L24E
VFCSQNCHRDHGVVEGAASVANGGSAFFCDCDCASKTIVTKKNPNLPWAYDEKKVDKKSSKLVSGDGDDISGDGDDISGDEDDDKACYETNLTGTHKYTRAHIHVRAQMPK